VGANTKTWVSFLETSILDIKGKANAAVFPVPVCACPSTSLPSKTKGIICA
jgi:hypothetical protein